MWQIVDGDGRFISKAGGGSGSGDGQLSYPYGVLAEGAELFVAESRNNRISVWSWKEGDGEMEGAGVWDGGGPSLPSQVRSQRIRGRTVE